MWSRDSFLFFFGRVYSMPNKLYFYGKAHCPHKSDRKREILENALKRSDQYKNAVLRFTSDGKRSHRDYHFFGRIFLKNMQIRNERYCLGFQITPA